MSTNQELISEARGHRLPEDSHEAISLIRELADALEQAEAEMERLHSWDGLMGLLDEHWPSGLIPTLPDNDKRDPGPRIVSLLRLLERAESRLRAVEKLAKEAEDEGLEHAHLRAEFFDLDCGICWATIIRQALGQVPGGEQS